MDTTETQGAQNSPKARIKAVLFDFGGVITTSPFENFNKLEAALQLPRDTIRKINSNNPDTNAWARLERSELDLAGFDVAFQQEALAVGFDIRGSDVLECLKTELRPEMLRALKTISKSYLTAILTNNFKSHIAGPRSLKNATKLHRADPLAPLTQAGETPKTTAEASSSNKGSSLGIGLDAVFDIVDFVAESAQLGVRKPNMRFYEIACENLAVKPQECIFLDDLGINCKPARQMGMHTIKVTSAAQAIQELERLLEIDLGASHENI